MHVARLILVVALGLAGSAAAADIPELPEQYRARYSRLLRLVVQASEKKGDTVKVEQGEERVTVRRWQGKAARDPVVLHLSTDDTPPFDLGELNYVVEHWRSLRFDQSVSEVRYFDERDERVVLGFASCDWKAPDATRLACRDRRRKALLADLEAVLKKLRKSKTLPPKPEKPPEDDRGRIVELIRAWCERSKLDPPLPAALRFFAQTPANLHAYSGARERILDSWAWVKPMLPAMREILESRGVPADLVYLSSAEAHFRPFLRSHAGAVGPWQFMPASGRERGLKVESGLDQRRDLLRATEAAARFLAEQYARLGDWGLAAIAYNQGPTGALNAVVRGGTNSVPEMIARARAHGGRLGGKTFRVGAHYWPVLVAERQGFSAIQAREAAEAEKAEAAKEAKVSPPPGDGAASGAAAVPATPGDLPPASPPRVPAAPSILAPEAVPSPGSLELFFVPLNASAPIERLAKLAGLKASALLRYNLALGPDRRHEVYRGLYYDKPLREVLSTLPTRGVTAPAGYVLALPASNVEQFLTAYLPVAYGGKPRRVKVRKGDTLWKLAKVHGSSVAQIAALNGFDEETKLRAGAWLKIPTPGKAGDLSVDALVPLADLAHRAEAARVHGRWEEAVRLYADLAASDPKGYLGRHARSLGAWVARRLVRAHRYGLDGYPRDPLRAAGMLVEWRDPSDGSSGLADESGGVALELARALIDAGDPWRARGTLDSLVAGGKQVPAARALLRGLPAADPRPESIALRTLEEVSYDTLTAELNPDRTRFRVDLAGMSELTVCVHTGESIGLRGEERRSMVWPAEPWCGSLPALRSQVAASLGASHDLDLGASTSLRYSVARGARVPLLPVAPAPAPPPAPAGG